MDIDDTYIGDIATRLHIEKPTAFTKGKATVQHIQKLDDAGNEAKLERRYGDNGFTDGRTMRKLGSIPSIFLGKPEYKDIVDGDQKAMAKATKRFFTDHPEFRTCNNNF